VNFGLSDLRIIEPSDYRAATPHIDPLIAPRYQMIFTRTDTIRHRTIGLSLLTDSCRQVRCSIKSTTGWWQQLVAHRDLV